MEKRRRYPIPQAPVTPPPILAVTYRDDRVMSREDVTHRVRISSERSDRGKGRHAQEPINYCLYIYSPGGKN